MLQDPANLIDRNGRSPEDVKKILDTFERVVAEMTNNGERMDSFANNLFAENRDDANDIISSAIPGTLNQLFRDGRSTLICGQQWSRVLNELNKLKLDDKWEFSDEFDKILGQAYHSYGKAESSNPNDPVLYLDPWKNISRSIPRQ